MEEGQPIRNLGEEECFHGSSDFLCDYNTIVVENIYGGFWILIFVLNLISAL